ncbi:hypothetical protein GO496_24500 [Acidovorax citrulli]|nr:hypothetical protein [Paracidovorax citrulli]
MAEESRRSVMQQAGAQPATAQAAPGAAAAVRPGVFEHGRGQFSDQATGMNFPVGSPAARPPRQTLLQKAWCAASRPACDPSRRTHRFRGFQPGAFSAPVARHSGNDWQARNDLRNAQVSASSIMNNGGRWDQHKGHVARGSHRGGHDQCRSRGPRGTAGHGHRSHAPERGTGARRNAAGR